MTCGAASADQIQRRAESSVPLLPRAHSGRENLEGHRLIERLVSSRVHDTARAMADFAADPVSVRAAQARRAAGARGQRHGEYGMPWRNRPRSSESSPAAA